MAKKITVLFYLILLSSLSFAQQGKGIITGIVRDLKTNKPLSNATVRISQIKQSTITNEKGEFKFENLEPGPYTLRVFHKEYSPVKITHQEVFANSSIFIPVSLVTASGEGEGTDDAFFIGGMEVTAKRSILPEKITTSTEISSGEIEHLQATNLGDVMQLIPGVAQQNQGLGRQNQLILSGISGFGSADKTSSNTAFGTKIMIDGTTISNNANLNTIATNNTVQQNAGGGVDLRGIPADNIESVEVLQGVASAKYGDFTEGVVIVKTKSGYQPQRLKLKTNPDTKEVNYTGGVNLLESMTVNYNFNFANSDRDLRREGDDFQRIAGQVKFGNTFFEDKSLNITNGFYFTRLYDDYKSVYDPVNGRQSWNHGFTLIYNNDVSYKLDNFTRYELHTSFNYTKQDKYRQDVPQGPDATNRYITGFMQEGLYTVVKDFSSYIYRVTDKGNIWNFSIDGSWSRKAVKIASLINNLSAGFNFQYDDNTGDGYQFDPRYPPTSGKRPFSYDATPGTSILSVYAEDEMHGVLWKPFALNLGLRYEMFSPEGINLKGLLFNTDFVKSRSGSFLEPRISFRYFLSPNTRIRMAVGRAAKSPSLRFIYPQPYYVDLRQYYGDKRDSTADQSFPVLFSSYIFDRENLYLRAYQDTKFELSFDQKITDDIGLTLRGYISKRDNEIQESNGPMQYYFLPISTHPNYPAPGNEVIKGYMAYGVEEYQTTVYSKFRGFNFILSTKRIESINSSFSINGAIDFVEYWEKGGYNRAGDPVLWSTLDSTKKKYHTGSNIIAIFNTADKLAHWYQKVMLNYKWDFVIRKLGLWFSLWAQQVVSVKSKEFSAKEDAIGYISEIDNGKFNPYPSNIPQEAKLQNIDPERFFYSIRDTWTFNINISKSLYRGAEVSFFVNNFLNRTNNIFFGIEFSADVNKIFENL